MTDYGKDGDGDGDGEGICKSPNDSVVIVDGITLMKTRQKETSTSLQAHCYLAPSIVSSFCVVFVSLKGL